jgi:phosphotransferase system enzyme I (PtsP)
MVQQSESESRKLLSGLQAVMAEPVEGQERLNRITHLIADSMGTEVCSIYLLRDADTLELCATQGLAPEAVHVTRMRIGEGLVGRVARTSRPVNTANAPGERGFRYMPETGEERYSSFLGVPIMRLGERLGVLVVQSKDEREYSGDEVYALEVVAMVVAEMTELGAFTGEGAALRERHTAQAMFRGGCAQEGTAMGHVWLHEPRVVVTRPVADDPEVELERLQKAVERLRVDVDQMLTRVAPGRCRAARGAGGLPDVRPLPRLDAPDGGGHRARAVGRGGGGEGTVHGARADGDGARRLPARPAA